MSVKSHQPTEVVRLASHVSEGRSHQPTRLLGWCHMSVKSHQPTEDVRLASHVSEVTPAYEVVRLVSHVSEGSVTPAYGGC